MICLVLRTIKILWARPGLTHKILMVPGRVLCRTIVEAIRPILFAVLRYERNGTLRNGRIAHYTNMGQHRRRTRYG